MATLAGISAKVNDLSGFTSYTVSSGTLTVDTNDWRTVDLGQTTGRAFRAQVSGSSAAIYGTVTLAVAKATLYLRMACKINNTSATEVTLLDLREGATQHVSITAQASTGILRAYRSITALQATAGNAFVPNTWFVLEAFITIHDSTGRAQIKVNGAATAVDYTGDTRNAGTNGTIDNIRFGACASAPNPYDMYFDDIGVSDSGYLGTGAWIMLKPNSNGGTMNWTRSTGAAGSEWDLLNDVPPNWNNGYIYADAATANTAAFFNFENLPATPTAIGAVIVNVRARTSGAGGGSVRVTVDSNGTVADGTAVTVDTTERVISYIMDTDPSGGGAWTEARVNGLQGGPETA